VTADACGVHVGSPECARLALLYLRASDPPPRSGALAGGSEYAPSNMDRRPLAASYPVATVDGVRGGPCGGIIPARISELRLVSLVRPDPNNIATLRAFDVRLANDLVSLLHGVGSGVGCSVRPVFLSNVGTPGEECKHSDQESTYTRSRSPHRSQRRGGICRGDRVIRRGDRRCRPWQPQPSPGR